MSNPAVKWNFFDSFLYKIESIFINLSDALKKDEQELPDPEEMITAATKHLQTENEQLKKKEYPGILKYEAGKYYCPDCQTEISSLLMEEYHTKYCMECGKRIMLPAQYPYATSHKKLNEGKYCETSAENQ